jgi:hypothetical protein
MKFDPRKPFDIWLDCFADVELADRPVFVARRCTAAEWESFGDLLEKQDEADGKNKTFEQVCHVITGWKNQYDPSTGDVVEYDATTAAADLRRLVSNTEVFELLVKAMRGQQPDSDAKKK